MTVFVVDVEDRPRINPARQAFFGDAAPGQHARRGLRLVVPGARLEVEAVALLGA